jgi:hypothetical protein
MLFGAVLFSPPAAGTPAWSFNSEDRPKPAEPGSAQLECHLVVQDTTDGNNTAASVILRNRSTVPIVLHWDCHLFEELDAVVNDLESEKTVYTHHNHYFSHLNPVNFPEGVNTILQPGESVSKPVKIWQWLPSEYAGVGFTIYVIYHGNHLNVKSNKVSVVTTKPRAW